LRRIAPRGADRTNYRRTLNRAYLVLSLIWIFAGLIFPLYQADQARASEAGQLNACIHAAVGNDLAMQACYERGRIAAISRDPIHAFRATYGDVQQWPLSILLVCILPPLLGYGLIRFVLVGEAELEPLERGSAQHEPTGRTYCNYLGSAYLDQCFRYG
jgi:hypothetical protein